ncbi:EAL domain-containing protein [Magnetospirillum fulvum]|uniref:EAL domain, c-di-GMP-specific phosphodiesterase class I (Or its enzymatically inactive variant) n=1 Tax=Magnetospirillum fulvum TaxID=1082 RepID=A0A1H6JLH3_MAGFU|nr:EAL domain-containing protein [Magnetospirillum fulvum]SEH61696.1 EAL domain, c-di-GMP-specific phosphodiesterase class I (or its enzymatically inactive variant) [Magnetospirillum fulvum]
MHQAGVFADTESGFITPTIDDDGQSVSGRFAGLVLRSVFQPLFRADTLLPVAHEALLRVVTLDGAAIEPPDAFARIERLGRSVMFDRLCRMLHVLNFLRRSGIDGDLFLNVHGDHLLGLSSGEHGSFIGALIAHHDLDPARVVLEIIEDRIDDLPLLQSAIQHYRQRGLRIAIDDFGARHSNFDRLWMLAPDVVKLDRTLILQAMSNPMARRILPKVIDIIHELGAVVVCEGIETEDQFKLARESGADLLQGFLFAVPSEHLTPINLDTGP